MNYTIVNGQLYHSDDLYHHGVKGMRWGVRKARNKTTRAERKAKKKLHEEQAEANVKKGQKSAAKALKIAGGVTLGVAAAAGTAYVGYKACTVGKGLLTLLYLPCHMLTKFYYG